MRTFHAANSFDGLVQLRSGPKTITRVVRWICLAAWLGALVAGVGIFVFDPGAVTAEKIAGFLAQFRGEIWAVYLIISSLRGFSLLPSTPLVLAGVMLFPSQSLEVLGVALAGIFLSSSMIYYFSEFLGFSEYFEGHKPELTHRIKAKLEHPFGVFFVALWAFFPFVPTDLICYLAGTTRMKYWKFIVAVLAGETVLCMFYVYFGGAVLDRFR